MKINTIKEIVSRGESVDILFWVGCAGSFDLRAQKITRAFTIILEKAGISYAILGNEETCTGDPARRSGNEFLFQMMAYNAIQTLNGYGIKKIVTTCPHCFNTLKNEYPELGGNYEVIHHTTFINQLIKDGKIKIIESPFTNSSSFVYHDSCYLGRSNKVYEAPREILNVLQAELKEMKRCKSNGLCCGAGGAQIFKEEEKSSKKINFERAEEAIATGADIIATACPFCNTMLTDSVQQSENQKNKKIMDIAEIISSVLV